MDWGPILAWGWKQLESYLREKSVTPKTDGPSFGFTTEFGGGDMGEGAATRTARLVRTDTGEDGTFGLLVLDSGLSVFTVELPWNNNEPGASCIPQGRYRFHVVNSPKHGACYEAKNVPGRDHIQIHSANWAHQLLGCIAPGESIAIMDGKKAVTNSKRALAALETDIGWVPFDLLIEWAPGALK